MWDNARFHLLQASLLARFSLLQASLLRPHGQRGSRLLKDISSLTGAAALHCSVWQWGCGPQALFMSQLLSYASSVSHGAIIQTDSHLVTNTHTIAATAALTAMPAN
jgi:hypothetical protein